MILNAPGSLSEASAGALFLKAGQANPTFTGDTNVANLTVNGNISMASAGLQEDPSSPLEQP